MISEEYQWAFGIIPTIVLFTDLAIRIGLSIRVILRKRPHGTTFAWLIIILLLPFFGALVYLLFGENRLSEKRASRARDNQNHYQYWLNSLKKRAPVNWEYMSDRCNPLHRQAEKLIGIPALSGNNLQIIETPDEIIDAIITDINRAVSTCHLQFYIWHKGGKVDEVERALITAVERGVTCRILLDAIGSRDFLKSPQAEVLKTAGIKIRESLPAGLISAAFKRVDIRNHRKIVVIDGEIAYTGSQNMVDPRFFKQNHGVGQWIDIMVRITGPVVESIAGTFISDWFLEAHDKGGRTGDVEKDVASVRDQADVHIIEPTGTVPVQLVPSGPGLVPDAIHNLLLTTIYSAAKELVLTTPYFVPDEALLTALRSAAQRGVDVVLILPEKNDSILVHYASQAHYQELAESGVKIMLFHGGLLHSKTITVDSEFSLIGSVNLDMRSFWLNFEATLFVYDRGFTGLLKQLQKKYQMKSTILDHKKLAKRPAIRRFKENVALLIGPLL
ncbi:MAG: cardiolipin synthase [Desulfocapsaceae bacterium]|jgi:cardiolipin synthase|nr:cardiolipin synthase [Desulfocapsaceae bacterium]